MTALATPAANLEPITPDTVPDASEHPLTFTGDRGPAAWERFVRYETERIRIAITRDRADQRPPGLRLSTDCPVRCVLEFHDPNMRTPIDPGIAERGHEMENRLRACLPEVVAEWQRDLPWGNGNGVTALDLIHPGGIPGECKSVVGKRTPSTDNRRQSTRMLAAAGMDVTGFWLLCPSSLRAYGPVWFRPTPEELADARTEIDARVAAMLSVPKAKPEQVEDAGWWLRNFELACRCGSCFAHNPEDADDALENLAVRYDTARSHAEIHTAREEERKAELKAALEEQHRLRGVTRVQTHWAPYGATRNKHGVWSIRRRKS